MFDLIIMSLLNTQQIPEKNEIWAQNIQIAQLRNSIKMLCLALGITSLMGCSGMVFKPALCNDDGCSKVKLETQDITVFWGKLRGKAKIKLVTVWWKYEF